MSTRHPLAVLDARIEARAAAVRAERPWWPCRRGCDACCRSLAHPPELSAAEWARVEEGVATLPPETQRLVRERIDALLDRARRGEALRHVTCPFLDDAAGACRIYEYRPITCRTYGFYVSRSHDQFCRIIEGEVAARPEDGIVWGNADALADELRTVAGAPIPFVERVGGR